VSAASPQPGKAHSATCTHDHGRDAAAQTRALRIALIITAAFLLAEVVGGFVSNSLALLADAGHMLTDVGALALSLFVAWFSRQPSRPEKTFGYLRWEILAALMNGAALLLISVWIAIEAGLRFRNPEPLSSGLMLGVAVAGLGVNAAAAWILHPSPGTSLNVRGAYLHITTDLAAFAGTVVAGVLILMTGWDRFDPIASLVVVGLMFYASIELLRESGRIFLEGAPASALPAEVGDALAKHPGVVEAHDLHVWTVTSGFPSLSAHVLVQPGADCHRIRLELEGMLRERFRIDHSTLQVEHVGAETGLEIRRSGAPN
jgi:cobalt-zinc-cadmium efflux system protein